MIGQNAIVPVIPSFGNPKSMPDRAPDESGKLGSAPEGRALRIVVIDDEILIAETVAEILKQEGFEAVAVSNGLSAIELTKTWPPDVVLSDVVMPGLNGIETGVRIREIVPGCKVILFSGQAATGDLLEDARATGHRFEIVAKPIKPEQLIAIIRSSFPS